MPSATGARAHGAARLPDRTAASTTGTARCSIVDLLAAITDSLMTERLAACSCGQLTATVSTAPVRVSVCHCMACQRRTGSVFGAQARFGAAGVRISGRSQVYVRTGDEGSRIAFHFCPDCGATVFYVPEGLGDVVAIPVGAFADPSFPAPAFSVYEDRKHAWVRMPDGIERLA